MLKSRFLTALTVSVAALMATSATSLAQPGGGRGFGGRDGMLPAINSRQVDHYSKLLNLSKDQKDSATALLEGYSQQAAIAGKAMREAGDKARQEFQDSGDPAVWNKVRDSMTKFRDDRKKLDDSFMNDFKSLLSPEQQQKWPAVERASRRDATLRWGRLSGERVDLVDLVEKLKLSADASAQINPVLAQYEEDLDRELVRRNEVYEGAMQKMMDLFRNGDMDEAQKVMEKGREAGLRVRDVNRKYARQIEDLLNEEQKTTFNTEFRKESFPDAYRPSYSQRAVDAAIAFKDLTSEQKDKLADLSKSVTKDMDTNSTKLAAATEESELKFNLRDMMGRGWRQEGPVADLRKDRRDLDRKALDSLKAILSPEQTARLPERDAEDNGPGGPGGPPRGRGGPGGQGNNGGRNNRDRS